MQINIGRCNSSYPLNFRGILEIELSHLLRETTEKTENVTIILDCCHAGRMARDPRHGRRANPKRIADVQYHDLRQHRTQLRQSGHLARELDPLGNPNAVRVMAAAATETAWECEGPEGEWTGALTDALASAIDEAGQRQVSWRSTLLRVNELVHVQFPQQHPVAEGPDTRLLFATQTVASSAVLLKMQGNDPVLQSGYVSGVRKGDVYVLMPAGHEVPDARFRIGEATVTAVNGFKAKVTVELDSPGEATHAGPSRVTEVAASSSNSIPAGEVTSTTTPTNPCTEEDVTNKPNSSDSTYPESPGAIPRWVLMCYQQHGDNGHKYAHVRVSRGDRDRQLFQKLKSEYSSRRDIRRSFRPVDLVHFTQFKPDSGDYIAAREDNVWPENGIPDWEIPDSESPAAARLRRIATDSKYLAHRFNLSHENEGCMKWIKLKYALIKGIASAFPRVHDAEAASTPIGEKSVIETIPMRLRKEIQYSPTGNPPSWGFIVEEDVDTSVWKRAVKKNLIVGLFSFVVLRSGVLVLCASPPGIPPVGATVAPNTTLNCGTWFVYTARTNYNCSTICLENHIAIPPFTEADPSLNYSSYNYSSSTAINSTAANSSVIAATSPSFPTQADIPANCDAWYEAQADDTCDTIAESFGITTAEFLAWNPALYSDCSSGIRLEEDYCNKSTSSLSTPSTTTSAVTVPAPTQAGIPANCNG
ncbi:hypothetical protein ASPACDRAFT_45892 [Aspergillus aculeatus ATCC 16872]|uniref:LysM domain-containing protein n=1 Tax=Aspergillus aculeatus (strain ATCC 16872 / CBS 172.66 / WB 5094) TaxID=690307 RepID=A0A1L9WNP0_ASPA1|nr:uncharacterized protein ASPACDRAFT_45892 [Aspergillus aculeatus ATCC 16872]OJJ97789.1 hypothetical protein ASPACDRAFT_45892 [Aspergillus aculeatus ATCC 16872]